jgi:hypothetical protein
MTKLIFHTQEIPQLTVAGARYVVVAVCGAWRDGQVTNDASQIPRLQRELRIRFMTRFEPSLKRAAVNGAGIV